MFDLSKWYADCISTDGDVFIGYCAQLVYGPVSLSYESTLERHGQRDVEISHSLRRSEPVIGPSGVNWTSGGLGVAGHWTRCSSEVSETVFRAGSGEIEWRCVLPRSTATIRTPGGEISGLGYVEHVRLTVPPWRIPIQTLRWGRVLTDRDTLVWIDWQGEYHTTIAYLNGARVSAEYIGDDGISLEGAITVELDRGLILRRGALGSTVLASLPGIERISPARMFAVDECKWRSRATLKRAGEPVERGWSIHEVVRWP